RDREADAALAITQAEQPVLAPTVGAAARLVVREVAPAVAALAVVLAYRAPLPLGEVGAEALPVLLAPFILVEAAPFGVDGARRIAHRGLRGWRAASLPLSCARRGWRGSGAPGRRRERDGSDRRGRRGRPWRARGSSCSSRRS